MINIGFDESTAIEEYIIDIRDKNQIIKARYALNDKDIEKNILMSEHYIQISFVLDSFVSFVRSDYVIWEGEKYIIKEDYIPDEVNKFNYKYTLRFDHWTTFLQDDTFYYTNQDLEEADWSLMSNAATHFQLIADNANRYFGVNTFNVGTIEFTDMKLLQFSKVSIWDAATQIAEAYGGEWYLTGTTFHLIKKFSYGSEIDFETEVSVEKMARSEGENSGKYTRILALGSTRNIPANYRETTPGEAVDAIYQKRLRIPASKGKFIDAKPNMSPEEVKSAVVIFEEVYPKRIGTMSSVSTVEYTDTDTDTGVVTKWNAYRYKDTGLQFKEEYILPGVELRIAIQSGNINGMDFAVKFNPLGKPETDPDSQLFEIIRNEDYGKALPNDILKPQNGDTYILYGFNIQLVSDQYVPAGEQELYDTAIEWLTDNNKDKSVFDCPTVIQHFADNEMDLEIGQKVKLIHNQFEGGFRSSRIQGYEKHLLNKYQATYTVGDNATYSRLSEIEESIKELQIAGNTYQATGRNGVYLITQFDNTPPSDFNAYSAKASDARYLNKQTGGTVQGDVTFQKKVKAKEVISDQFGNETFTSGQFGSGFRAWLAANGQSYAEFDNLMVRREMIINTLTIAEIKSVGGQILLSLANMYCNGVTDGGTYYKCTFDTDNGTITNQFAVDDQVICRKFNGANIKYYWARITSIGTDYINISKSDKDGSGIPAIGDEIIQFGNRTNTARQSAIMLSAYGSDAPSIKQYAGINSYNLTGKEVTIISPSGNKFTGDFVIQSSGTNVTTAIDNAQSTAISTAATDATNKVNAIQIGSRNLIPNTNKGTTGWNKIVQSGTVTYTEALQLGVSAVKATTSGFTSGYHVLYHSINRSLLQNTKQYTLSIDVFCEFSTTANFQILSGSGLNLLINFGSKAITANTWTHIELTATSNTNTATDQVLYIGGFGQNASVTFANLKLEEGNKATSWTPAPEDVQANIDTAQTSANNAATAASNAQTSANTANSLLADIANDNLLIPSEKQDVLKEWQIIQGEYLTVVAQATTYSVSSSDYTAKYNTLNSYITPLLSNMTANSTIVATTFRSNFKAYYDAKIALLKLVTDKAKTIADAAQTTANTAVSNAAAAQTAATNAQTTANTAVTNAATANALVSDIANDNKFTPNEKSSVRQEWNVIASEISVNNTQADTFGITTEKTAYNNAFQSLATYLNNGTIWTSGIPSWISDANLSVTTTITGSTFRSIWKAYYDARTSLLNAIATKAKTLADAAQQKANSADTKADAANAGLLTKVAYSEYNSQMQILNNQISSKVSQSDFNVLGQRVSNTESSITQQAGQISSVVIQVDTAQTTADNASLMAKAMSYGKMLYKDPSFTSTANGVNVYNNYSNGNVVHTLINRLSDTPTTSPKCLEIKTIGSASPGFGGFYFATTARANAVFIVRFIAKIPTGLNVNFASNSYGAGGTYKWLTSSAGTGAWQEYICMVTCGSTGTFSTTNFFNLSGTFSPSSSNPLIWYLAYATVYDITDAEINFQDLINTAQTTANSKNRTYYQDAQPTAPSGGFAVGDIWQKVTLTDINGNVNSDVTKNVCRFEYRWNGTTWIQINFNISGSYVTQTNDSITSLVTKTGIDSLGTGETLKSLIDQTPGKIELAVSAVKVGSRNLLPNTNQGTAGWGRTIQNGTVTFSEVQELGVRAVKATTSVVSSGFHVLHKLLGTGRALIRSGVQYTLSLDVYCDFATTAQFLLLAPNGTNYLLVFGTSPIPASTWTKVILTGIAISNTETNQVLYITGFNAVGAVTFANLKLEEGNKATSWTPAIEDTQADITAANTAANNAATAASAAQTSANTANNQLADIASDNRLTPNEKSSVRQEWNVIASEISVNNTQADTFGITTEKTAYNNAFQTLANYLNNGTTWTSGIPSWISDANLSVTTIIIGTTFRSTWKTYYDARTSLLNAISAKAKAIADSKTDLDTVKAGITINADGVTAFGNQFRVNSTLIANAIQTQELNVGNGNFKVGTDGKASMKGAIINGLLSVPFKYMGAISGSYTINLNENFNIVTSVGAGQIATVVLPTSNDLDFESGIICHIYNNSASNGGQIAVVQEGGFSFGGTGTTSTYTSIYVSTGRMGVFMSISIGPGAGLKRWVLMNHRELS